MQSIPIQAIMQLDDGAAAVPRSGTKGGTAELPTEVSEPAEAPPADFPALLRVFAARQQRHAQIEETSSSSPEAEEAHAATHNKGIVTKVEAISAADAASSRGGGAAVRGASASPHVAEPVGSSLPVRVSPATTTTTNNNNAPAAATAATAAPPGTSGVAVSEVPRGAAGGKVPQQPPPGGSSAAAGTGAAAQSGGTAASAAAAAAAVVANRPSVLPSVPPPSAAPPPPASVPSKSDKDGGSEGQ